MCAAVCGRNRTDHAPTPFDMPTNLAAMYKVTGSMQKSTEVMKLSNQLIKLPQMQRTMREMSAEMMKVGAAFRQLETAQWPQGSFI